MASRCVNHVSLGINSRRNNTFNVALVKCLAMLQQQQDWGLAFCNSKVKSVSATYSFQQFYVTRIYASWKHSLFYPPEIVGFSKLFALFEEEHVGRVSLCGHTHDG
jgi:hypothetical protein